MTCTHPKVEIPADPHGRRRYELALKHVEAAKKRGASSEELHAIYKKVMEFDFKDLDSLPQDEAHAKYRSAALHMQRSLEAGKSVEEAHEVFRRILRGETSGKCKNKKQTQGDAKA